MKDYEELNLVNVSYNTRGRLAQIGPEGAHALAAVLPDTQIHTLNFGEDYIGAEDGEIRSFLKANKEKQDLLGSEKDQKKKNLMGIEL